MDIFAPFFLLLHRRENEAMMTPSIQFSDLTFKYHSQQEPTLKNIHLKIKQGEKILILGPSGSGKSTLAHLINGLIPHRYKGERSGELYLNGNEAFDLDLFSHSKVVGTVLQDTDGQFIGLIAGEDIAFSLENENVKQDQMHQIVEETAKLVEVDSHIDYSIHELSGGLKQRVSLAGVLVDEEVDILLFDEPLANLDPKAGQDAMQLIEEVHKATNKTIVMIEHRLEDALQMTFDRIIVMDEGEVISDTSPRDLLLSDTLVHTAIREPLYIRALKYAQADASKVSSIEQLANLRLTKNQEEKLQQWIVEEPVSLKKKFGEPLLELENVEFYYEEKLALTDISFTLHRGEMVSIVGKNGAGKSTLAKVICGFEQIDSGDIRLAGRSIKEDSIFERASKIGHVLQNPNHMISKHLVVKEVALGLELRGISQSEITERVEKVLKICGLYPMRNWPIQALSYGQKKRVTIASMLVLEPEILILDEPTAGQDLKHYTEMLDFLKELNQTLGMTILFITHDMHLMLEYTDRALVLADGECIGDDTPSSILTNDLLTEKAHLKRTSLFDLGQKAGITDSKKFVDTFIEVDRKNRKNWKT